MEDFNYKVIVTNEDGTEDTYYFYYEESASSFCKNCSISDVQFEFIALT